jgi:hypothetical protein
MKILSHRESHIVELDDGSKWKIFPGDLDLTLTWRPETILSIIRVDDQISTYALDGAGERVHVIPDGESWPPHDVESILKRG